MNQPLTASELAYFRAFGSPSVTQSQQSKPQPRPDRPSPYSFESAPANMLPLERRSSFGYRSDPKTGRRKFHSGEDISRNRSDPNRPMFDLENSPVLGMPAFAVKDGVVEQVKSTPFGYGNQVVINHGDGMKTRYAHLQSANVKKGDRVEAGWTIGKIGSTGRSTGPHLHFELELNGKKVDPGPYLAKFDNPPMPVPEPRPAPISPADQVLVADVAAPADVNTVLAQAAAAEAAKTEAPPIELDPQGAVAAANMGASANDVLAQLGDPIQPVTSIEPAAPVQANVGATGLALASSLPDALQPIDTIAPAGPSLANVGSSATADVASLPTPAVPAPSSIIAAGPGVANAGRSANAVLAELGPIESVGGPSAPVPVSRPQTANDVLAALHESNVGPPNARPEGTAPEINPVQPPEGRFAALPEARPGLPAAPTRRFAEVPEPRPEVPTARPVQTTSVPYSDPVNDRINAAFALSEDPAFKAEVDRYLGRPATTPNEHIAQAFEDANVQFTPNARIAHAFEDANVQMAPPQETPRTADEISLALTGAPMPSPNAVLQAAELPNSDIPPKPPARPTAPSVDPNLVGLPELSSIHAAQVSPATAVLDADPELVSMSTSDVKPGPVADPNQVLAEEHAKTKHRGLRAAPGKQDFARGLIGLGLGGPIGAVVAVGGPRALNSIRNARNEGRGPTTHPRTGLGRGAVEGAIATGYVAGKGNYDSGAARSAFSRTAGASDAQTVARFDWEDAKARGVYDLHGNYQPNGYGGAGAGSGVSGSAQDAIDASEASGRGGLW